MVLFSKTDGLPIIKTTHSIDPLLIFPYGLRSFVRSTRESFKRLREIFIKRKRCSR